MGETRNLVAQLVELGVSTFSVAPELSDVVEQGVDDADVAFLGAQVMGVRNPFSHLDGMRGQPSPAGVVVLFRARSGPEFMEHRAQAEDIVEELRSFEGFSCC